MIFFDLTFYIFSGLSMCHCPTDNVVHSNNHCLLSIRFKRNGNKRILKMNNLFKILFDERAICDEMMIFNDVKSCKY